MSETDFTPADYSACRKYPQGCFSCRHFMLREAYFCKAYNIRRFGQDRVSVDIVPDRRPWWVQEKGRKACLR